MSDKFKDNQKHQRRDRGWEAIEMMLQELATPRKRERRTSEKKDWTKDLES